MKTLHEFFSHPTSTLTYDYNKPELSKGLLGDELPHGYMAQDAVPPPQKLYDLASYWTPFRLLWRRPRNVLN